MSDSPSFKGFRPSSPVSSLIKRANRAKNAQHEVMLRRELWRMGFRYRKNVRSLLGTPDIVFFPFRVVVFCDGDFWHGRDWIKLRKKLAKGANGLYWTAKIQRNMEHDSKVTKGLNEAGWQVVRLWETDIRKNANSVALHVKNILEKSNHVT